MRDGRRRLRVITACGISLSQMWRGKVGSTEQSPAMKWFLNVCMARSALFLRCRPDGVSWKSMSSLVISLMRAREASLSRRWSRGCSPLALSIVMDSL